MPANDLPFSRCWELQEGQFINPLRPFGSTDSDCPSEAGQTEEGLQKTWIFSGQGLLLRWAGKPVR